MRGYMGACQNNNVKELEIYHKLGGTVSFHQNYDVFKLSVFTVLLLFFSTSSTFTALPSCEHPLS